MHYTPQEEDRIRAEIDAAKAERSSASAPSETACQPRSLALATGSESVTAGGLIREWERRRDELRAEQKDCERKGQGVAMWCEGQADALERCITQFENYCRQEGIAT